MDNVSILQIIWSQINSVLICSIRVSIKSFTFQRTVFIAQSFTFIFDGQFWFSESSKICYWQCKILTFKLFFFVTSSLKSSIKFPTEGCLLVTQFEKKTPFWAESKAKMTESAQKFQLFDSHQNSNLLFFHKSKDWLFQKKTTKKITFVKKYSIEKPKISIITPEKPHSKKIQGVFL